MTRCSSYRAHHYKDPRRRAFIEEALSWVGTPYHHHACVKGRGVDCVHLLIGAAHGAGLTDIDFCPEEYRNYRRMALDDRLVEILDQYLVKIAVGDLTGGDVVVFKIADHPQHVGIMVSGTHFVHAHSRDHLLTKRSSRKSGEPGAGKVVETRLTDKWLERVVRTYRFPEFSQVRWY